nr:MAG TPA: hypothetical protein [Siphoviridae sp. cta6m1]
MIGKSIFIVLTRVRFTPTKKRHLRLRSISTALQNRN